jgi:hypothetical protein
MTWEGRPTRYQLARIDVLRRELDDVAHTLADFVAKDLPPVDAELLRQKLAPIKTARVEREDGDSGDTLATWRCLRSRGADCPEREAVGQERD